MANNILVNRGFRIIERALAGKFHGFEDGVDILTKEVGWCTWSVEINHRQLRVPYAMVLKYPLLGGDNSLLNTRMVQKQKMGCGCRGCIEVGTTIIGVFQVLLYKLKVM